MPIPAAIGAALIGAGTSAASNVIQNAGGKRRMKYQARLNREQWELQNEYNTPSAQIERLKAAGLNPNLIYGTSPTSAVGNAGAIAPVKQSEFRADNPIQAIATYANLKQTQATTNNTQAQNEVIQNEAALKLIQGANLSAQTAKTSVEAEIASKMKHISMDFMRENLKNLEVRTFGKELENAVQSPTLRSRITEIVNRGNLVKSQLEGQNQLNELRRLEKELNETGIQKTDNIIYRMIIRFLKSDMMPEPKMNPLFKN